MRKEDPTIAELLKAQGYATGQFGKNHLGDKDEMLPTAHGFDEFYGNLYRLDAEEASRLAADAARRRRRPDMKDKLLTGYKAGKSTFKVHLDGYNILPYLTGREKSSPRRNSSISRTKAT